MLKRIGQTDKDYKLLQSIKYEPNKFDNSVISYKNVVVKKPWGYEFLIYESSEIAVWILYLNNGCRTSFHAHIGKCTSLIVASGSITFHTCLGRKRIFAGDGIEIDKGVFHQSIAEWDENAVLIEIESPPNKSDLVRADDSYGRENMGYEGINHMIREDVMDYNYFYVVDYDKDYKIAGTDFSVALHRICDQKARNIQEDNNNRKFRLANGNNKQYIKELGLSDRVFEDKELLKINTMNDDMKKFDIFEIKLEG